MAWFVRPFRLRRQVRRRSENRILTHREQEPIVRGWIEKRFDTLLPELMRREGIDMWIIVTREYNSDPVFRLHGSADDL